MVTDINFITLVLCINMSYYNTKNYSNKVDSRHHREEVFGYIHLVEAWVSWVDNPFEEVEEGEDG